MISVRHLRTVGSVLRIDLDPGQEVYTIDHLCALLRRAGRRIRWLSQTRSGSGKGWHIEIAITPGCASPIEVVALQAICGSDRYREACNVLRVRTLERLGPKLRRYWGRRWNVLYDPVY